MKTTNFILLWIVCVLLSSCGFNLKDYKIEDDLESKQMIEKDLTGYFKKEVIANVTSEVFKIGQTYVFFTPVNYMKVQMDDISYEYATNYEIEQIQSFINKWCENGYAPGYLDDIFEINSAADGLSNNLQMISKKNQMISDKFKLLDSKIDGNVAFLWERQSFVENSNVLTYKVTAYISEVYSKDYTIKFQLNENEELEYFID